ncbi:MAG: desulfoferrodoxin [Erysipelotrichaceae bacterium]|nr:desulfoferrodoxin [Erysipelotrichaceae bacterium]
MQLFKGANGELVEVICPAGDEIKIDINGAPAEELKAGTTDAATEKHVPAVSKEGNELKVQVGEVKHPMLPAHWITNIWVEFEDGSVDKKTLLPGEEPAAVFDVTGKSGKAAVYEYCNLHGLWKNEIDL